MMAGVFFLIAVIFVFSAIFVCVEYLDRRENMRQRRMWRESVRCTGMIRRIERRGALEGGSPYRWRVVVEFEYDGKWYSITEECIAKPVYHVGGKVSVLVDASEPERSIIAIK